MRHDLTSLKLFIAVAECGNLTRAAEREHLAVSAVSKRIAELESLIGTALLQRQARGVSLTPAGQSLLHHARQLMQLVQRMDAELGEYAEGVKGHVRLHVVASALTQFLPEEVESFLGRYPLVNVEMVEQTGKAIVQAVSDGQADIGVVAAYGKILTEAVLAVPALGMINVHASLLPKYRGAAPVHRAVIAGETVTGVTIMRVVKALDAGAMLATLERPIGPNDTSEAVEFDLADEHVDYEALYGATE